MRRWLLVVLLMAAPASGRDAGMTVELVCRPEVAVGRLLCELKLVAARDARLAWADALVIAAPDFVRPLRSRVAPERFGGAGTAERKLSLAFVASKSGNGQVTVRARAVVCRGQGDAERCRPETREARADVRVGS